MTSCAITAKTRRRHCRCSRCAQNELCNLFKQIDRVAGGLARLRVGKGDVVMIALPNIRQAVIAVYACSRIGAIASMIHPKLSADEFGAAFDKLKPKAVF